MSSPHLHCVLCQYAPARQDHEAFCVHQGVWHTNVSECSIACFQGLGLGVFGASHYSCCHSSTHDDMRCHQAAHLYNTVKDTMDGKKGKTPRSGKESKQTGEKESKQTRSEKESKQTSETEVNIGVHSNCTRYRVNLDAAPVQRWQHVMADFKSQLPQCLELIDSLLGTSVVARLAETAFGWLTTMGMMKYNEELRGIADSSNIPLGKIAMLQIAYEVFASCTSIVVDLSTNGQMRPYHIRTMDWEMPQLAALTIEVDFVRAGQILFTATTWAGYVGVLTGMKPNAFSVSVNYRRTAEGDRNTMARNIFTNLSRGALGAWPVAFLIREVMESPEAYEFSSAVAALQASSLMAPTYITVAGVTEGQGVTITRDRHWNRALPIWDLHKQGPVVQANMDHFADGPESRNDWQDICASRRRRQAARKFLNTHGAALTPTQLWRFMSKPPCLASDTIYTVAMQPATDLYVTRV